MTEAISRYDDGVTKTCTFNQAYNDVVQAAREIWGLDVVRIHPDEYCLIIAACDPHLNDVSVWDAIYCKIELKHMGERKSVWK